MSATVTVKSGNDATDAAIASSNCAYCAVGGLVGKSANEIMADVYAKFGGHPPTGGTGDDGADGFARLYVRRFDQRNPLADRTTQNYQIKGIVAYLELKGCTVAQIGASSNLLNKQEILEWTREFTEGTLFLAFTGDEDVPGRGITSRGHWTVGQVQGGKAVFYDYQMKMSGIDVRTKRVLESKAGTKLGETGMTDHPVVAWGQELDDDEGRGVLLVVSKLAR